jgi:WD40 repeat protein
MSTQAITAFVTPYKGLAPFEDSELDALLFFGRERETEVIVANLLASNLTVLYGPSGVGKSSILRAAVAKRLRELAPGAEVVILDEWATDPQLPDPFDEAFLILDQFEEYFLYHEHDGPLHERLPALLANPHVHVLVAVREDALARLDAFQARIPNVFANRLRLDQLDVIAGRAAVVRPLDRWNAQVPADEHVRIEDALVDGVLAQVQSAPGRIEAPYLQLVMERIWEAEREAGSSVLRAATLERLGGATHIVSEHLERALGALPARDAEIATSALKFLVTPSRTKIAQSFGDLVGYTNESPVELQKVLEVLASQRILRAVADGEPSASRYEIFHDVLAEPVLVWRRDFEARAALAAAARRQRRLAVLAGGALLLAAAMVALTVFAFAQRSEASKQRRAAVAQTELALGQKRLAQQLRVKAEKQTAIAKAQTEKATKATQRAQGAAARAKASAERAKASEGRAKASEAQAKASEAAAKTSAAQAHASAEAERRAKQVAVHLQGVAQRQATAAKRRARIAKVGELVANAEAKLDVEPAESLRSAVSAAALEVSDRVEDALRDSLMSMKVRAILDGGGGVVNSAVFSPDGSLVATAAQKGQVHIYRTQSHTLLHTIKVGSAVNVARFSPNGALLAVGSAGAKVLLYDVKSGELQHTLTTNGAVFDVAFVGGGTTLVTGEASFDARMWDVATGSAIRTLPQAAAATKLAVSLDGAQFAVMANGQAVAHIYSAATGDELGFVQQPGELTDLAFSPNGKYLVTTGRRNGFVWDAHTFAQLHILSGHEAPITDVVFANDGRVITSSVDSAARVWDPATGEPLFTLLGQHQQKVLAVAVSPDGTQIATASADNTVRLWNSPLGSTPLLLGGHTDSVSSAVFSPDGRFLLTGSADGTARLWDTAVAKLTPVGSHAGAVSAVAFSPDGSSVLSGSADGTAKLWRNGSLAQTFRQGGKVTDAVFGPGGRVVLTAGDDGTAKLWRAADGALLATLTHGSPVRAAAFAPDGRTIVTAADDGTVRLWTEDGKLVWTAAQGSPLTAAVVSNGLVATGAANGSVRLWHARNGASAGALAGHTGPITSLAFSSDGSLLISGSADHTARMWSTQTGKLIHALVGHTLGVTSVSFSANGKLALTASVDGDARIWSVASGQTVHRLKFHVSTISQAAFSPDGRWVVTAGPTTAAIWQVRTGDLLYFLNGAKGNLTSAAWAPDSLRIVAGDSGGGVEGFDCSLCARQPALTKLAKERLAALR